MAIKAEWCPPLIALAVGSVARLRPARAAVMAPLPDTRQLKESNSAREKTPPHTRGGIRANKTQNPPFSHTPKYTWMKNPAF